MFKDLLWDFDGTLFDTYPGMVIAFEKALYDLGLSDTRDSILKLLKISFTHAFRYYEGKYNIDDRLARRFSYYEDQIDKALTPPMEYAADICRDVVKSGGRNFIYTHRDKLTLEYLREHDMLTLFEDVVTKDSGFRRKPDPEGFLYIINNYKIDKDKILAVGDRNLDVLAAKNAGIKSCFLDNGESTCTISPDYTIKSLKELYSII